MIIPKYVAVQAYLEATGTAFAELRYIEPLLEALIEKKEITLDKGREILEHKSDVAKTVFNLFQHIGIIKRRIEVDTRGEFVSLTNYGRFVLENKKPGSSIIQPLTPFFLSWLPFKLFLKYLLESPGATTNEIRTALGSQIVKHTTDIKELNISDIIRRGAYIPFNEMVIGKVLANIGDYLGLVTFDKSAGPFYLSPLGKYVTNSLDLQNFQFKNLDPKVPPLQLTLLDFLDRGVTNIIVFSNMDGINELKFFHKKAVEDLEIKTIARIIYNKTNFEAMISTDSAYWSFTKKFSNLTYDPIKVLEFNSKVMDYIEI
ncbi:MAG TPA: hypothetical protein VMX55_09385 [candidate division Zixibacteria bacterium]|nr:hypothetical protein [candidate division Zixibacteria bacterium]